MEQIRPRLYGDRSAWEQLIDLAKEKTPAAILRMVEGKSGAGSFEESKDSAKVTFTVDNPPTTLEEALEHSNADLSVWTFDKWIWNHWAGRYQVKIWFVRKEIDYAKYLEDHFREIRESFAKVKVKSVAGSKVGVVSLADFHYGFDYKGDIKNPAFSVEILTQKLREVAAKVNALGYKEVHLALLGDFIESFTGLNHMDVWKNLSQYGSTAARGVSELIATELVGNINNVARIYVVAGNHDRVTVKSDIDSKGEAAKLIVDFLDLMLDTPISFDYAVLNPVIDGIKYIFTHGHLGLSKRDEYATVLEYGDQSLYNIMLQGHRHTREVKKGSKYSRNVVDNVVSLEGSNFRRITVPPLVTGGAYSLGLGVFGTAGMTVTSNNGYGGADHLDLSV